MRPVVFISDYELFYLYVRINFIVTLRDISAYMKRNNVLGSSAGYVERICDSYDSVDVKNVPIFLSLRISINGYMFRPGSIF